MAFKTTLQEILNNRKNYQQKLEKRKELFERKMLKSNRNKDLGVFSQNAIVNPVAEFNYMLEGKFFVVFSLIWRHLQNGLLQLAWPQKISFVQRKLGSQHTKFVNYILPKKNLWPNFKRTSYFTFWSV